jgi:hypothetical protein
MGKKKRKLKSPARAESKPLPVKTIFNYAFLISITGIVSIVFLPVSMLRYLDGMVWEHPFIPVLGIFLTVLFLILNRQTIAAMFSEPIGIRQDSSGRHNVLSHISSSKISGYHIILVSFFSLAAFGLYGYELGSLDFWDDEFLVVRAAEGYRQTGTYYLWDFVREEITSSEYRRAWPHTWLVSQSYGPFGVSEWSSRIISAAFGSLFVFSSFFVVFYFTKNAFFAMTVTVVFLLNPDFIYYFRHARMYALVIPLFFIWSAFVFKAVEGRSAWLDERGGAIGSRIYPYVNFDYRFVLLSLFLLFWAYHIHVNMLLMIPVALAYILAMAVMTKERKYFSLAILIIISGVMVYVFLPGAAILKYTMNFVSFFESIKPLFLKLMVQKPFSVLANLTLLAGSIALIFICPEKEQKKKLFFCLLMVLAAVFFYMFLVDFHSQHFRYVCYVIPFSIMLICFTYFMILRVFNNRYILALGLLFLFASQTTHLIRGMPYLYHGARGQPWFSVAYATVRESLLDGDVIFAQYLRDYYMRGIPKDTPIISLGRVQQDFAKPNPYNFEHFFNDIQKYKRGWVIWESSKEFHVHPQVAAYVKTLFKKIHGAEIDDTNIEVYFFDESMVKRATFR